MTVITSSPRSYRSDTPIDPQLLNRVPGDVRVLHAPTLRPFDRVMSLIRRPRRRAAPVTGGVADHTRLARPDEARTPFLRRWSTLIDELAGIPDKEVGWVLPALSMSLLAVLRWRADVIYSSAPPWSGQLVALAIAYATRLPWVADFRDPWARAPWREARPDYARRAAIFMERLVIRRADAVLFATKANRDEYAAHYGSASAARFHFVRNGCDVEEFASLDRTPRQDGTFVIVHTGSLYGARSPLPLFRAIAAGIRRGALDPRRVRLRLVGATGRLTRADNVQAAVSELGLTDVVEFVPRLPRREALAEMASASCLLALQPGTTMSVPGKMYEYLAIGLPILALTDEGETADLVRQSGNGIVCDPHDERGIERALVALAGAAGRPVAKVPMHLYDGAEPAAETIRILDHVLEGKGAGMLPASSPHAPSAMATQSVKANMKSNPR
jgi:glycosyltransferase involved in cell wall biosynthesis